MDLNFGANVTNCGIIFDANGNYSYQYPTNSNLWIHGNNWNGMVIFPNGLSYGRISNSGKFNKRTVLPKAMTNMGSIFTNCFYLNQNIQIPNGVTKTTGMFRNCRNLNQNIQIPNGVTKIEEMFDGCRNLNQNIRIPNNVTNTAYMFNYCTNLNQNIQIPNNVTNTAYMFNYCANLNQNIQIPNNVTNATYMFSTCQNLNQNIQIPNSVTNVAGLFFGCPNLNQNIRIPNNTTNMWFCFRNSNVISDITIESGIANNKAVGFISPNNKHARNIWTDSITAANLITTNIIHPTNASTAISSQILPTWETITNGYYNSQYNVYIYTNAFN